MLNISKVRNKVEVATLLLQTAANWINNHKDEIIDKASKDIYNIIDSYRNGKIPLEESKATMEVALEHLVEFLGNEQKVMDAQEKFVNKELITFEDGIASKRVVYEMELEDVLLAISYFRDEIWNAIGEELKTKNCSTKDFLVIEKRINEFVNLLLIRIASTYHKKMEEVIGHQALDLKKWEEVIKSAYNIELKIPCKSEFVAIGRLQAEAIARRLNYTEEEVHDIKVAVGEACDNSIEHGVSEKGVDLHYHLSPEEMKIEIIDYGPGFDPSGKGKEPPDPLAERGRGIFLMRTLMDRAEIYSRSGEGTMIVLAKKRN